MAIGTGAVDLWQGQHPWPFSSSANKVNLFVGLGPGLYEYGSKSLTSHHFSCTTTKDDRLNLHILHQSELWSTGVTCKSAVKVVTPTGGIIIITKDKCVGLIACKMPSDESQGSSCSAPAHRWTELRLTTCPTQGICGSTEPNKISR